MKITKAILSLLVALGLVIALNTKFGDIPPIGKFLDPFNGFWQNAESKKTAAADSYSFEGLKGNVEILFDEHRIPHIFAGNNYDAYFAQGYITAHDRLWQMDIQTRSASGRLSEIAGEKALQIDRYQRRMGMTYGAENMVVASQKDPIIKEIIGAYAAGVNAYIKSLKPKDYPIEFKILDYKPEEWKILNTALLLKLMSATLAGGSNEFYLSNIQKKYGSVVVKDLFPDYPFREDPIIPAGTKWDFKPLPVPSIPANPLAVKKTNIHTKQKEEGTGSNNWAISGSKSATGYPILANDPHLDLTLPAIWYQIQITTPQMNVYGVSIPGAPCVIIGYNEKVAWGVTNVGADVLDWYSVKFRDASKNEYWYNNSWRPVKKRIETIPVRGGKTIIDTVYYTHQGPVTYLENEKPNKGNIPAGHALRWTAHDGSDDLRAFYSLNIAKNYTDYRNALPYMAAPAQNFVFASVENDIAITSDGYFPLKWKDQGKLLLDGSDAANDWHGRIPADQNPTVKNPVRGFVSSANQSPTDQTYPYYINWEFASYDRAHRINNRLKVMNHATVDSLRMLQNDTYSNLAENVLPVLIGGINPDLLSATERESYNIVSKWNKFFNTDEIGASIFEIWQKDLAKKIWNDDFGDPNDPMITPSKDRTVELLINEPDSHWFDDISTPQKETRNDLIQASFKFTVDSLQRKFGSIGDKWKWANVKHSNVPHLGRIPGFGSKILYNGGSKSSVNALAESNGPSWRMVISLGKDVKGYGVYPGGQSGNPGSFYYDDMIDRWTDGQLNELLFLKSKNEKDKHILSRLTLTKK
jgi:penicillin amidase